MSGKPAWCRDQWPWEPSGVGSKLGEAACSHVGSPANASHDQSIVQGIYYRTQSSLLLLLEVFDIIAQNKGHIRKIGNLGYPGKNGHGMSALQHSLYGKNICLDYRQQSCIIIFFYKRSSI